VLSKPLQLNVTLPQNTVEIYAELYASGNGAEEFWVRDTLLHIRKANHQLILLSSTTTQPMNISDIFHLAQHTAEALSVRFVSLWMAKSLV
jgi:hypothetical protein